MNCHLDLCKTTLWASLTDESLACWLHSHKAKLCHLLCMVRGLVSDAIRGTHPSGPAAPALMSALKISEFAKFVKQALQQVSDFDGRKSFDKCAKSMMSQHNEVAQLCVATMSWARPWASALATSAGKHLSRKPRLPSMTCPLSALCLEAIDPTRQLGQRRRLLRTGQEIIVHHGHRSRFHGRGKGWAPADVRVNDFFEYRIDIFSFIGCLL